MPLVALGLTGSMLVFEHELGDPHYELTKGTPHILSEIVTVATSTAPEWFSPSMVRIGNANGPTTVFLAPAHKARGMDGSAGGGQGPLVQMIIDPVSLAILNKDASHSWMHNVQQFHSSLLMRDYGGRSIVGWFGVIMLVFGITGVVLWWPRHGRSWVQSFTIKSGARGFRLHRDLHGVVGIWACWCLSR